MIHSRVPCTVPFYQLSSSPLRLVENFAWDEKNLLTKTKSDVSLSGAIGCNVCSQGVQVRAISTFSDSTDYLVIE